MFYRFIYKIIYLFVYFLCKSNRERENNAIKENEAPLISVHFYPHTEKMHARDGMRMLTCAFFLVCLWSAINS